MERILPDSEIPTGCWQALSSLGRTSAVQFDSILHCQHLLGHNPIPFILEQPWPVWKKRRESSELTTSNSCCSLNCCSLSWTWFELIMWSMWTESSQYWARVQHPTDLRIKGESPSIGIQNILMAI